MPGAATHDTLVTMTAAAKQVITTSATLDATEGDYSALNGRMISSNWRSSFFSNTTRE
jgi:hypothetical protein